MSPTHLDGPCKALNSGCQLTSPGLLDHLLPESLMSSSHCEELVWLASQLFTELLRRPTAPLPLVSAQPDVVSSLFLLGFKLICSPSGFWDWQQALVFARSSSATERWSPFILSGWLYLHLIPYVHFLPLGKKNSRELASLCQECWLGRIAGSPKHCSVLNVSLTSHSVGSTRPWVAPTDR